MNLLAFLGPLQELIGMGRDALAASRTRKQAKLQSDLRINEARTHAVIEKVKVAQTADIAWENLSVENSGWKDEWFTILLSIPMILCFIPGGAEYVKQGFNALSDATPDWYQYAFLVAVASAFGFKKLTDLMKLRKGD